MCTREVLDDMNTTSMSIDQFRNLVDQAKPFYVTMNGLGEPLLDKTIFDKLALLHAQGIMTAMPTNGTLIQDQKLENLSKNLPDVLQLTVDGATKETFEYIRVRGKFEQIIANYKSILNLQNAGKSRPGSKIRMLCALQKRNLYDYRAMFDLVEEMKGLASFHLIPVFDYDAEGSAFEYLLPSAVEIKALHDEIDTAVTGCTNEKQRQFFQNWKAVSSEWLSRDEGKHAEPSKHACLIPWYNSYVDAKGRVYPCCYLSNSEHVMGNINDVSFPEIWHGTQYQEFRKKIMRKRSKLPGCRTCPRNDDQLLKRLQNVVRYIPHQKSDEP